MERINNDFYNHYGERWYTAQDDPVAILRAENKTIVPWLLEKLKLHTKENAEILDIGCGGGLLSNELARHHYRVTGLDQSEESLNVAKLYDETKSVTYVSGDALNLPFRDHSFDVVTAMDFLEHVERPDLVMAEISRVLRPHGTFYFHTFNKNFLSYLVVIKLLEWFVKNTPKNMHVIKLFIKPKDLKSYCLQAGMRVDEIKGLMPVLGSITFDFIRTGVVPKDFRFKLTNSSLISYLGYGSKIQ